MLSKGEAAALLSLINAHHGNAQWDDVQLDAFYSELRSDITAVEAREAVRRFYADINGIVRKLRNGAKPSEAQIGRECERLGLVEDQAWLYRRQRMMGRSSDESRRVALAARDPLRLPPAKPKRRREGGGFNPGLGVTLDEVLATRRPAES